MPTIALLVACTSGEGVVPTLPTVPSTPTVPPEPTSPEPTPTDPTPVDTAGSDTGHTADTGPDPCVGLPTAPLSWKRLSGVPSTEEFHFDATGLLWSASSDDQAVYETPYGGQPTLLVPFSSFETAGARVTPDGLALAVCDEWDGAVVRVDLATGATSLLVGGLDAPNSIGFDDRGFLYVAAYGQILRASLSGGPLEVLLSVPFADFDGITFSPDYDTLYFNHDEGGEIGKIEMDADGNVLSVGIVAQIGLGWGGELDGMATDACGNLFVVLTGGDIVRVEPSGASALFWSASLPSAWTTSLNFGSGVGGWMRDRLYVMDRANGMLELEVGVEGRPEPHLP